MKNYLVYFLSLILLLVQCAKEDTGNGSVNDTSKLSVTGNVTDVTANEATLHAYANLQTSMLAFVTFGVQCSENPDISTPYRSLSASSLESGNKYSITMRNLDHSTKYYYRSYVEYVATGNKEYGDIKSFSTLDDVPVLTQPDISTSSTLTDDGILDELKYNFSVKDDGGSDIIDAGIICSEVNFDPTQIETIISKKDAIKISNVKGSNMTYSGILTEFCCYTKYYIMAYATNSIGTGYSSITYYKTDVGKRQRVNMGLSVKWAVQNVGAYEPGNYFYQYAWGDITEVTGYSSHTFENYKWCNGTSSSLTKYNTTSRRGIVDNKTTLDPEDDVANNRYGDGWRMPTDKEWKELRENCTWEWTKIKMQYTKGYSYGYKVTSKIDGYTDRSIFLPAAGYESENTSKNSDSIGAYWSSSLYYEKSEDESLTAGGLYFTSEEVSQGCFYRCYACSVRPVHD